MMSPRLVRATVILLAVVSLVSVAAARKWTSRDGKFTTDAELVDFKDGEVKLQKSDGNIISVPLWKLSDNDQEFVRTQYPDVQDNDGVDNEEVDRDFRDWASADGKFSARARFIESAGGKVRLEKPDGKTIDVPLIQLSERDRTWVKDHTGKREELGPEDDPDIGRDAEAVGPLESSTVEMKLVEMKVGKGSREKSDARTRRVLGASSAQYFYAQSEQAANPNEERFKGLVKTEPTYEYPGAFRAVSIIGAEQYAFALDATGKNPQGYNRLYFDLNRNGDLTDDTPFNTTDVESSATANQTVSRSTFDRVPVLIERDGTKGKHVFGLFVDCIWTPQTSRTSVQMRSLVYREGEIRHGGRKIHLMLLDRNSNGRFDDRVSFVRNASFLQISDGDLLLVNPKLRGNRSAADSTNQDTHFVNRTVCLGGGYYKLDVSPLGDRVKLEPTALPVGYVSNGSPVYRVVLCCDDYGVMGIAGTTNQKVAVPAGKWEIANYSIGVPGPEATMVTASFQDRATVVEVSQDATTELTFGAPFRALVSAGRLADGKLALSLSLVGCGGERCSSLLVGGKRPPAPAFEVRDQEGKVVYSGKFEYG